MKLFQKIHLNKNVCVLSPATVNSVPLKILPAGPNVQRDTEQFDDHCMPKSKTNPVQQALVDRGSQLGEKAEARTLNGPGKMHVRPSSGD